MAAQVTLCAETISAEKTYGRTFVETVRGATSVDAQRIIVEYPNAEGSDGTIKVTPKGNSHKLNAENATLLKRAFLKESEADLATKLCTPLPGIRYTFRAPSGSVSILVCYRCRIGVQEREGRFVEEAYVDHIISELRRVAESFLTPEEAAKLP